LIVVRSDSTLQS